MKTLSLRVPENVNEQEVKMAVAVVLFDKGIFSSGQSAEFVGISKREFLENAGKYGVSVFGERPEDLERHQP